MGAAAKLQADRARRQFDLEVTGSPRDLGELQYNVLLAVSEKRYDDGLKLLQEFQKMKASSNLYVQKTESIFKHAEELVHAVKAKKSFPNLTSLPQNKQEEMHQKILENWEDLKISLRRLRTIERDMELSDARSSIWIFKAILFSFVVILTVFVVNETFRSFGHSLPSFAEETYQLLVETFNGLF